MKNKLNQTKRLIFMGIIITSLGVVLTTTLAAKIGAIGIVFIAVGGLLFIIGMNRKKQEEVDSQDKI
jgi:multisubunit Na+/H+ antiporter MnhB subunit